MPHEPGPEFSLVVAASDVAPNGTEFRFEADAAELKALALRFGVLEVCRLAGRAKVRPYRKAGLTLEASFEAEVVQSCVVTLDPVHQTISEAFKCRYLPAHMIEPEMSEISDAREIMVDAEDEDAPEPMIGSNIDVGEAVAEQLSLAIDPYPRKPEVVFDPSAPEQENAPETRPNPFAALEKLKKNY